MLFRSRYSKQGKKTKCCTNESKLNISLVVDFNVLVYHHVANILQFLFALRIFRRNISSLSATILHMHYTIGQCIILPQTKPLRKSSTEFIPVNPITFLLSRILHSPSSYPQLSSNEKLPQGNPESLIFLYPNY